MSAPVRLAPRPKVCNCEVCPEAVKTACREYGCPFDTALDAPGVVVGRSYGLIAARMGATGRTV